MSSPNSLKNMPINISLYFNQISKESLQDSRFVDLQNILSNPDNLDKYTYSLYSDNNLLAENIFMPIFHSAYLASGVTNVILEIEADIWLTEAFPNNRYFYMTKEDPPITIVNNPRIRVITSIQDIGSTL